MAYYVDANEQRERARRATQVFLEHSQKHYGRPQESEFRWARNEQRIEDQAPANSFVIPDPETNQPQIVSRPPSVVRRAARFRDGLPPPPLPRPESSYPHYVPPPNAQLLPQHLVDQGFARSPRSWQDADSPRPPRPITGGVVHTPAGEMVSPVAFSAPQPIIPQDIGEPPLSKSQKKRLRKQRSQASKRGAPFPLPQDQPLAATPQTTASRTNGVHPTPGVEHAPRTCTDEKMAEVRPGGALIRLRCSVEVTPHIGQPHTMPLSAADNTDTTVYVVWWGANE